MSIVIACVCPAVRAALKPVCKAAALPRLIECVTTTIGNSACNRARTATVASVAFFAAQGIARSAILAFAGIKLVVFIVRVARQPEFRIAAADYGVALAILLAGAAFVQFLPDFAVHISKAQGVPDTVYGAALILIVLLLPTGVAGGLRRALSPLTTRLYTRSQS